MMRLSVTWIFVMIATAEIAAAQRIDSTARRWTAPATLLGDPTTELERSLGLLSDTTHYSLLRSASSLTPRMTDGSSGWRAGFVLPHVRRIRNSDLPYSLNDGALWAGRGSNWDIIAGGRLEWGPLRVLALPELVMSDNKEYLVDAPFPFPQLPPSREPWAARFFYGSQSIDLPMRFGDKPIRKLYPGQSSVAVDAGPVEIGGGSENNWWGPGMQNALLLTNHAAGFPHLFARTPRPLETRLGRIEARWMAGGLSDSRYFDVERKDDLRSIALLGVTLQPRRVKGLTIGAARSVYSPTTSWASALTSFFDVFHDVGQPDARALDDTTASPGPDQLLSLFGRWTFPNDGFEVYAEWGRAEFPKSLRDFLEMPNHTQAYVLGLQWLGPVNDLTKGRLRVQGEASFLQQSTTFRFRPIGSWYTSATAPNGYTQQGQVVGAAIGPGSSSQWLAIDHVKDSWSLGAYANRIRWLEDAHSQAFAPFTPANGWCEHDVSLLGGFRGTANTRWGSISADYSTGWRYNLYFLHDPSSCPENRGTDVRNKSLSMTFTPARLRW